MNLPEIENETQFAFGPLFLADEHARALLVLVTRATFSIETSGGLHVAEEQMNVNPAGEFWNPDETGSYRYEPDAAFVKLGTDLVLVGSACAQRPRTTVADVGFRVGTLQKTVRVFGDRYWIGGVGGAQMTRPAPFERIPLRYEKAFGGWDRSHPDPDKHTFEPRNPLGNGFRIEGSAITEDVRLPNLEDPRALIKDCRDRPAPVGFGFTSPDWQPRAALAGTYDSAWAATRKPLLPKDFNRRYFSGASAGLIAAGFLTGGEPVIVHGCTPQGRLEFALPAAGPIEYTVRLRNQSPTSLVGNLDTVVVDTDALQLHLTWRARVPLKQGAQEVQEIKIRAPRLIVA